MKTKLVHGTSNIIGGWLPYKCATKHQCGRRERRVQTSILLIHLVAHVLPVLLFDSHKVVPAPLHVPVHVYGWWVTGYPWVQCLEGGKGDGIVNADVQVNADVVAAGWIWSDNPLMPCSTEGEASCQSQAYIPFTFKIISERNDDSGVAVWKGN